MVERKLYKTKLCLLYQRGRCSRQYCNFAHGDAELRRSFNVMEGRSFEGVEICEKGSTECVLRCRTRQVDEMPKQDTLLMEIFLDLL